MKCAEENNIKHCPVLAHDTLHYFMPCYIWKYYNIGFTLTFKYLYRIIIGEERDTEHC